MALPLMPHATAIWLVENTALTFEQISEFCGMHNLEVQAIADGEVDIGMQGLDPIVAGQLTLEGNRAVPRRPREAAHSRQARYPAAQRPHQRGALYAGFQAPGSPGRHRLAVEDLPRAWRRPDLQAHRHHQADDQCRARQDPLEHNQHQAAEPRESRPLLPGGSGKRPSPSPAPAPPAPKPRSRPPRRLPDRKRNQPQRNLCPLILRRPRWRRSWPRRADPKPPRRTIRRLDLLPPSPLPRKPRLPNRLLRKPRHPHLAPGGGAGGTCPGRNGA